MRDPDLQGPDDLIEKVGDLEKFVMAVSASLRLVNQGREELVTCLRMSPMSPQRVLFLLDPPSCPVIG
jgi:hypothetical protein